MGKELKNDMSKSKPSRSDSSKAEANPQKVYSAKLNRMVEVVKIKSEAKIAAESIKFLRE